MPAYITGFGVFLPNDPVTNDRIESVLGSVAGHSAQVRDLILSRNGIATRHYVIDPATGRPTHTNAQLTAEAVHALGQSRGFNLDDVEVLACGTSSPDQLIPSHAAMVHGLLGIPPCELVSLSGVCCSGVAALKYGVLSILAGNSRNAVATGSEVASLGLLARNFPDVQRQDGGPEEEPHAAFDREFLRWMLSDGAGAVLLEDAPRPGGPSLKIDWVDIVSMANELETCMYLGAVKAEDGSLRSWRELDDVAEVWKGGYLNISQDVPLLRERMLPVAMRRTFERVRDRRGLAPGSIDWFLPHLSSYFFKQPTFDVLAELGFAVPFERWFTNLETKGNTGAASIYIMLEELCSSGRLGRGDRLLCAIPESARFTFAYMHLTVV